jgi:hypothetical protein
MHATMEEISRTIEEQSSSEMDNLRKRLTQLQDQKVHFETLSNVLNEENIGLRSLTRDHEKALQKKDDEITRMRKMVREVGTLMTQVEFRDKEIVDLKKEVENLRRRKDIVFAWEHGDLGESFDEVMLEELRSMREAFEHKLSQARADIVAAKEGHMMTMEAISSTFRSEKRMMEMRTKQMRAKIDALEIRLSKYEEI